ncbi:matrixin family metalloprotease [Sneathiella limimaris]|uniref:matrixin family metalloprotease n=1 Tax=Sneathiella limimaris TaxID=1964213 RepID=UPI00146AE670|nr:matrixin family metalloprotease [Sneathiella limimaris]
MTDPDHHHEIGAAYSTNYYTWGEQPETDGVSGGTLTYSFVGPNYIDDVDIYSGRSWDIDAQLGFDYEAQAAKAFEAWSSVANVNFVQVSDEGGNLGDGWGADIRISMGSIDGSGNNLAFGAYPNPRHAYGGDIFLDGTERSFWTATSFFRVMLHEIGHSLGLKHSDVRNSAMWPTYGSSMNSLKTDDINGIRELYGNQDGIVDAYQLTDNAPDIEILRGIDGLLVRGSDGANSMTGSSLREYLWGGAGDDTLIGGGGVDTLSGGFGSDWVDFSSSNVKAYVQLSRGIYELDEAGEISNIENVNGTRFADSLRGSEGDDNLVGNGGDDRIVGHLGHDTIDGGAGEDWLHAGPGDDLVYGGTDFDSIRGSRGWDTLMGQGGDDYLNGGQDEDYIHGGSGDDLIYGQYMDDTLHGGAGDDTLYGSSENDYMDGGTGADELRAGSGDDTLIGGGGADTLIGGRGLDLIDFSGSKNGVDVDLAAGVSVSEGIVRISTVEAIRGSAYDDTMAGDDKDNLFYVNLGNDIVRGGGGVDTVYLGGRASDYDVQDMGDHLKITHIAGDQILSLYGVENIEYDLLLGDGLYRVVTVAAASGGYTNGTDENERIIGSSANDHLYGYGGQDQLFGGEGDDILTGSSGDDYLDGEDGADTVRFDEVAAAIRVDLNAGTATGDGNDTLLNIENIFGGKSADYRDTLLGNDENNYISDIRGGGEIDGRGGDDRISVIDSEGNGYSLSGGDGDDTIDGGDGNDTIFGGDGNDNISDDAGSDIVYGGLGDDTISSRYDGEDTIYGGFGNDSISAFGDTVYGGDGDDYIEAREAFGGRGNDTLRISGGYDSSVSYSDDEIEHGISVDLSSGLVSDDGYGFTDTLLDFTKNSFSPMGIIGSRYDDTIIGGSRGAYVIDGGGGDDFIQSNPDTYSDKVRGGQGDDTIQGNGNLTLMYEGAAERYKIDVFQDYIEVNDLVSSDQDTVINAYEFSFDDRFEEDVTSYGDYTYIDFDQLFDSLGIMGADTRAEHIQTSGHRIEVFVGGEFHSYYRLYYMGLPTYSVGTLTASDLADLGIFVSDEIGPELNAVYADGNSEVYGTNAADQMFGDAGASVFYGYEGADQILGYAGNDSLRGGAGDDTVDGGTGEDFVDYRDAASLVQVNLGTGVASSATEGNDVISNVENIYGSDFEDTLRGDDNDNVILDPAGGGVMYGMGGNDSLDASNSDGLGYELYGGDGDDILRDGNGADLLVGGAGADSLFAWDSGDTLIGGAGEDILNGYHAATALFEGDTSDYEIIVEELMLKVRDLNTNEVDTLFNMPFIDFDGLDDDLSVNLDQIFDFYEIATADRAGMVELMEKGSGTEITVVPDGGVAMQFEINDNFLGDADLGTLTSEQLTALGISVGDES